MAMNYIPYKAEESVWKDVYVLSCTWNRNKKKASLNVEENTIAKMLFKILKLHFGRS